MLTKELERLRNIASAAAMAERFHAEDAQMWSVKMQNLQSRIAEGSAAMEPNDQSELRRLRQQVAEQAEEQQERSELTTYFTTPVFTPVRFTPAVIESIKNLAPGNRIAGADPKRISLDFTEQECGVAVSITQLCRVNSREAYLTALCLVFSPERANALLEKITR